MSNNFRFPKEKEFLVNDEVKWRTLMPMKDSWNITTGKWYEGRITRSTPLSTSVDITDDKGNILNAQVSYDAAGAGMADVESLVVPGIMAGRKRDYISGLMADENKRHNKVQDELFEMLQSVSD